MIMMINGTGPNDDDEQDGRAISMSSSLSSLLPSGETHR
jgi:hypothetical protein